MSSIRDRLAAGKEITTVTRFIPVAFFIAALPAANMMISYVGFCPPHGSPGPCMLPVAPGILAPSGAAIVGATFVLRPIIQESLDRRGAILALLGAAAIDGIAGVWALVPASVAAFLVAHLVGLWLYEALAPRSRALGMLVAGLVGVTVDSLLFLGLAFGTLEDAPAQIVAKAEPVLLAAAVLFALGGRWKR